MFGKAKDPPDLLSPEERLQLVTLAQRLVASTGMGSVSVATAGRRVSDAMATDHAPDVSDVMLCLLHVLSISEGGIRPSAPTPVEVRSSASGRRGLSPSEGGPPSFSTVSSSASDRARMEELCELFGLRPGLVYTNATGTRVFVPG